MSLGDHGAIFAVLATNVLNGTGALSTNATLTVTADTTGPGLIGAAAGSQTSLTVLDGVAVAFSEKVSVSTANNRFNYTLTGPQGAVPISTALKPCSLTTRSSSAIAASGCCIGNVAMPRSRSGRAATILASPSLTRRAVFSASSGPSP